MDQERTIDDARSICGDLRAIFERQGGPGTLEEVERLCKLAKFVIEDPRCRGEVDDVLRYSQYLLSGDHRRWARGTTPGPVFLCELILDILRAIDIRLAGIAASLHARRMRSVAVHARRALVRA